MTKNEHFLQLFGQAEYEGQPINAMINIDDDIPNEGVLHIWGSNNLNGAALVAINHTQNGFALDIKNLYKINDNGTLGNFDTSQANSEILKLTISLLDKQKTYEGEILIGGQKKGWIKFFKPIGPRKLAAHKCANWEDFKSWVAKAKKEHNVCSFRGQSSNQYTLKATIHRSGKYRLERYCAGALIDFKNQAEGILGERIDINNGEDYAMLLGLAQHHGLPTPLLDWSGSPYIAAFFAFSDLIDSNRHNEENAYVRVYCLTKEFIDTNTPTSVPISLYKPYVSFLGISPRNNPRLNAQQGQFIVTNIGDLETYIQAMEDGRKKKFLIAADIPVTCIADAFEDLNFMGLNAATMFPGLDGICRKIRHSMIAKKIT